MDEIEERREVGESDFTGLRFTSVGDALQERLDKFNREFLQLPVTMVPAEWGYYRLVGS
jgi:hypothetical protein